MTTKAEAIAALKKEYPKLISGDDERGYQDLSSAEYEATIEQWANNQLANESNAAQIAAAKASAEAKLAALGLTANDLKALGL